jgi:cytochrome c553
MTSSAREESAMPTLLRQLFGATGWALCLVATAVSAGPLDGPGAQKALVCSACHGFAGNSRGDTVPILAGADAAYLKKALGDYAAGRRLSPEMEPYGKMALHFGVDDIVAYFASQTRQPTPVKADSAAVERGRKAAAQCAVCHGADGKGDRAKLVPDLTGQPPGYLRSQLSLFKQDQRSPGDESIKAAKLLIRTLSDETLADLAAYYSTLR